MNDNLLLKNWRKFGMKNSFSGKLLRLNLATKVIIVSSPVFFLFLIMIGSMSEQLLTDQIIHNADQLLITMSRQEASEIDNYFSRIEILGEKSARVIQEWIVEGKNISIAGFNKKYKMIDGAIRSDLNQFKDKNVSGVFLSNLTSVNEEIKKIILATELKFEEYAKATKPLVFNMYLITKHQLIRIYEKEWALEIEADHDFRKDIFYNIGMPEKNPEKKAKWTNPYYDSIWKRWMTSLIVPIYINEEFIGIVGHDVILNDVYNDVVKKKYFKTGYGFIFDIKKNIIVHPKYISELKQSAEMGTLLSRNKFGNNLLIKLVSDIVEFDNNFITNKKVYKYEDKKHYVYTSKLNILNWYYSIDITESEFISSLPQFRKDFLFRAFVLTIILFVLIVLVIWFFIIKPIKKLKLAINSIISGDFKQMVKIEARDEIGELTLSFNHMIREINNKILEVNDAKERFKKVLLHSEEGIFQSTVEGEFLDTNPAAAKILGYKDKEDLMANVSDIRKQIYVKNNERDQMVYKIKNNISAHHCEVQVYKKDGSIIWVELREKGIRNDEGNIAYIEGFFNDITERKRSEEILTVSNTILKAQQETSPDGILIVDENLKTVDYNERFLEMWGIPEVIMKAQNDEEVRNYIINRLVDPEQFNKRIMDLYENPFEKSYDIVELKNEIYFERYSTPLISKDGTNIGRIWHFHDISVNIKIQKDLIEAKERAESSDKLKSEFLAQVSHEIRTPINAVLSFSQLIKEELKNKIDSDLQDGFRTIDNAGRRIIRTIDLILNMSELQSGSYDYVGKPINVYRDAIFNIYNEYKHFASEKNIDVKIIKNTNDFVVIADEYTVSQIFSNLLDNAIKYTMKGKVEIVLLRDEGALVVEVKDTGIGISKEYLPNLFKEFTQEEQGYTRRYEGNGLGLALVKKYCELNKAEITVNSTKNVGTTFRVKFSR